MIQNLSYIYTLIYGKIPEQAQQCITHNTTICERAGVLYKIIPFTVKLGDSPAGTSNFLRQNKAATEPRILYLDWDVKIQFFPDFDPQIPKMAQHCWFGLSTIDQWAIYNGDRLDIFREILNLYKGKIGAFGSYFKTFNTPEIQQKFKRFVPDKEFKHYRLEKGRKEL